MSLSPERARPLLVYDGECGFCRYWVRYWQRLTGAGVEYREYQSLELPYRGIERTEFARSIHWFHGDAVRAGAAAAFEVLATVPGHGAWRALYRHIPGFAVIAESFYRLIAAHRIGANQVARMLWGPERWPETVVVTSWLFVRGLALVYVAAFASLLPQILGLVGSEGILPLRPYLAALQEHYGASAFRLVPCIFWFDSSDPALRAACFAGLIAATAVLIGVAVRLALAVCFALYLSLFYAGQTFMTFQWDLLLLESGFIAIFMPGAPSRVAVWLQRWLLFRFMFMSGWVKLASGDAAWSGLTALQFHFETQPLPTVGAWFAHQIPAPLLQSAVAVTLFVELALPWLLFMPRRLRHCAAGSFLVLELIILLTGNYNFFNLLTMLLCLACFDDQALAAITPVRLHERLRACATVPGALRRAVITGIAAVLFPATVAATGVRMLERPPTGVVRAGLAALEPLRIANVYGVFAVMTTERYEIVIEGSNDRDAWYEYEFRYKPGALDRAPRWSAPHQPRVDWQMWFAALSDANQQIWFQRLLERLLRGEPTVLALLETNPFPDAAPHYVRARFYRYQFTDATEHAATGQWWKRRPAGEYYPIATLGAPGAER